MYYVRYKPNEKIIQNLSFNLFYNKIREEKTEYFNFQQLENVQALDTGQYHVFKFSSNEQGAHCTGLVTCAALIIVKTYEHTFDKIEKCLIYHVPSGVVKEDFLLTAKKELSIINFNDCIVVFAHPGEKEKYKSSLDLLNNHVLNFKLIDLSNINHSFGMQSDGIIGF